MRMAVNMRMEAKLRRKFVVVTTSLMIIIFGVFLTASQMYNEYWATVEMKDYLNLLADSGLFLREKASDVETKVLNIEERETPIIGLILNDSGEIMSKHVLGKDNKTEIPGNVISYILENGSRKYKADNYVYAYRTLDDSTILVVLTDVSNDANLGKKAIGMILLIPWGIIMLVGLTFFLSRFVTEPAQQSLLREKQFIANASHELKTPLGAISVNAQALDKQYPENIYVKNIVSESDRMGRLIERLLTLSRLEEKETLPREKISLSEIAEEMVLTFDSTAFEKRIDYRFQTEDDINVMGNADEMRQLLAILIDNAIKNTDEAGTVEINCSSRCGKALLVVRNTGQGISEEDLPHVFDRFYTSDRYRDSNSYGLGLAIARTIVERYGGSIDVKSTPGEITEFTVVLKLV